TAAWDDKGHFRLSLMSIDLPISKSHLLLHHPPLFRVSASPAISSNNFRVAPYEAPASGALRGGANPATKPEIPDQSSDETRQLVSRLNDNKRASRPTRNLPLQVAFPHFGPSIFLVSELTSENQTPIIELDFQR